MLFLYFKNYMYYGIIVLCKIPSGMSFLGTENAGLYVKTAVHFPVRQRFFANLKRKGMKECIRSYAGKNLILR